MSKRYGRQQKRKARDEVDALTEALAMNQGLIRHMGDKLREADAVVQHMVNAVESVCRNSIALTPQTHVAREERDRFKMMIRDELNMTLYDAPATPTMATFRTVDCYKFETIVNKYREEMQLAIHINYRNERKVSYMISEQGLQDIPMDYLVRQVSNDLVRLLKEGHKKALG